MKYEIKETADKIDVYITDLQMHVTEPRKPKSWYFKVMEAVRTNKVQRAHSKDLQSDGKSNKFRVVFPTPPDLQKKIDEAKAIGKEINFILPPGGAPVFLGKDTIEKIEADKKKNNPIK